MKHVDISRFDRTTLAMTVIGRVSLLDDGAIRIEGDALRAALKNGARNLTDLSAPPVGPKEGEAFLAAVAGQFDNPMTFQAGLVMESATPPAPLG